MHRAAPIGIVGLLAAHAAAQPMFQGLGDLPGGEFYSEANGVSGDGYFVVGASVGVHGTGGEPFRWTAATGMQPLSPSTGRAYSASGDGFVSTGLSYATPSGQAFRWHALSGFQLLSSLIGIGGSSSGQAVSGSGVVIVGFSDRNGPGREAFRWAATFGMVGLGDLAGGSFDSAARGVSFDGSVIVGYGSTKASGQFVTRAFRWTEVSGMVELGLLAGGFNRASDAYGVSGDGTVVVGECEAIGGAQQACRWVSGSTAASAIGFLAGGSIKSVALAASHDGSTIVGYSDSACGTRTAFVWTAALGLQDLRAILEANGAQSARGWQLLQASAVSSDGLVIVGWGVDPSQRQQAWRVQLAPGLIVPAACYANCDGSVCSPMLNVNDFICFANRYAAADPYANCDGSTVVPVLNVADFICFLNRYAAGCP